MSESRSLVKDGTVLFVSTLIVNAGNYAINLLLGRWLGPSDFSEVSLLVTLMLMISFLALGYQLTAAKFTAEYSADNRKDLLSTLVAWLKRMSWWVGLGLAAVVVGLSFFWQEFFQTTSYLPFIIFGVGLPFYLLMSVNRGVLQGLTRYRGLALTYQAEMWTRLIVTVLLVYLGFGVNGVAWGLTLSLVATLLVAKIPFKPIEATTFDHSPILNFLAMVLLYECSQILINNSDVMIVKHYFPPFEAGLYAALALIGRIVYFGTWTVVTLLFPMVIKLEKEGKDHSMYFLGGLVVVATIAAVIVGACYFLPELMVGILFGDKYLSVAPLLWLYATATALFACANVFVYYHLSLDRRLPIWITLLGGACQILFLTFFHDTFEQVIWVQVYLMIGLFSSMVIYHFTYRWLPANIFSPKANA